MIRGEAVYYEEGKRSNVNIILEFPSAKQMNNWLKSEPYQKISPMRSYTSD